LSQGLQVALIEVTMSNPPTVVQVKELVLAGWKREQDALFLLRDPKRWRSLQLHSLSPHSVKDLILQCLSGPCSRTRIRR